MNNVIVLNPSELRAELVNVGAGTAPETFVFGNDLWFAPGEDAGCVPVLAGGVPPRAARSCSRTRSWWTARAAIITCRGTPAIGAARALDAPLPSDFDGRCYADPAALGAFEAR